MFICIIGVCVAFQNACKTLNDRLAPIKEAQPEDSWEDWVSY